MQDIYKAAGLNEIAAKAYLDLLKEDQITPTKFAEKYNLTRTNAYKLLDELVTMGLASRFDVNKRLHYRAVNPNHLLTLARQKQDELDLSAQELKAELPSLLKNYYSTRQKPGITYFQGKDDIKQIFVDQINSRQPIDFLKTDSDIDYFGFKFMHEVRNLARKANIGRHAFTPDSDVVPVNVQKSDHEMLLNRTWYLPGDYTAPVEWAVYGNKVSIISFEEEGVGMVIESQQIAEALRQMFKLLDEGLRRRPGYKNLPTRGEFVDAKSFIKKYKNKRPLK